ncbi:redoxin domain-containing protein [Winogradskyella sp. R77965]|uniref:peroxiredoxin family protein n=1 Tax=Winogradskyella sp. R77965 TaxID=3093872 RepID=UPI0037DC1452
MKKSTYLLIGFLVFFFGTILALHIDSKNYEEEYLVIREKNIKSSEYRTAFFAARKLYYDDKSAENWDYLLQKAKLYFSSNVSNTSDYNTIGWDVFMYYKKHNDITALKLAEKWTQIGVKLDPKNGHINDTYAAILFELGFTKQAIKHQTIAVDFTKTENLDWRNHYTERLERYKDYLDYNKVEIGDRYIDAALTTVDDNSIPLSKLVKDKATLLSFWNPTIGTSKQITRALIPVHQKFKNKGLQIIGISKSNSPRKLLRIKENIQQENLEWLTLIDVNSNEKIWDKYGVIDSNNANILIDENGRIIAININAEELNVELETLLGK